MDISSEAHKRPSVRYEISSLHASGGESLAHNVHHPVNGPRSVPVLEWS